MCGIAGMVGVDCTPKVCEKLLETMTHRGPDGSGVFRHRNCCLLHKRLAVVDLQGGVQPMSLVMNGCTYTIVYNGELYNTEELRSTLIKLGHIFIGHSDTEVVLHAYAQWLEMCLPKFNGIFSFAVWEHKRNKLFLARDPMGVKPLFYTLRPDGLLFASEIKTLLAHPDVPAHLDGEGVLQLLMLGPGRMPGSGVFKNIYELEPGCFGYYLCGKWNWKRYWQLCDREHSDSFEETAEKVRYLVTDAIKRQMVADVPVGTFLSGGLDSSLISSVCAKQMAESGERLSTFSVEYENNDKYFVPGKFQPNADGEYIRLMQQYLHTDHHWSIISPDELALALEAGTKARDLPGMADVDFSLLLFCRQIRKRVKVALSGECADEIFGGYPWFTDPQVREADGFPWAQNTEFREGFLTPQLQRGFSCRDFVMDAYLDTVRRTDVLPGASAEDRRMKQMINLNYRWFMQTLLDRKDRMSMASSLEVRVPFCDVRIADYMYSVPWAFKHYGGREKGLLRYAMKGILPDEVLFRKKSPYPKTYDPRYLELVSASLHSVLDDPSAPLLQVVDKGALEDLLVTEHAWPWYGQLMKKPQTIAYMLQLNFWLKHYNVEVII